MTPNSTSHFLLVPAQAWGHIKPQCHLALRLLAADDRVIITMLMSKLWFDKAHAEVTKYATSDYISRIRVLCSSVYDGYDVVESLMHHSRCYAGTYKTLIEQKPITCLATGTTYESFPAPAVVIMDFISPMTFQDTKALTGNTVPVYIWGTGALPLMIHFWGPEYMGGLGNIRKLAGEEAARTRNSVDVIGERIMRQARGKIVEIPGILPIYDHEMFPQEAAVGPGLFIVLNGGVDIFEHGDGLLAAASLPIEGDTASSVKRWFAEAGKDAYTIGPLLPSTFWSDESDHGATDVRLFLEEMQARHGDKSVVLVSFGSFFWPPVQEYIDEVIAALIEKGVPFIFAHPSPFSKITPELEAMISESGLGMLSSWIPQQYVLKHPATGWFLTHGGQGGVTEALGAGVPLICWPINADQPLVAVQMVKLGVAFELIEVRSGDNGLKPIHRLGGRKPEGTREAVGREIRAVIDDSRGNVGQEMRRKAMVLKEELKRSWDEDGAAAKSLRQFVKKISS